jgi:hypothetical protein
MYVLYVWLWTSLDPERFDGFYSYAAFKSLIILGHCPLILNIIASKTRVLQIGPRTQTGDFFQNGSNDFREL